MKRAMKLPYVHKTRDGYQAFTIADGEVKWGAVRPDECGAIASLKERTQAQRRISD
jgi:hypothetical protein